MTLRDRLPPHGTITEFDIARRDRHDDASVLASNGRCFGAMYLLGYFAEMTLKCVFFRLFGFRTDEPISAKELREACALIREDLQVSDSAEQFHSVLFWARAIVRLREDLGGSMPVELMRELVWRGHRIHSNWRASMRYSRDVSTSVDLQELQLDAN